MSHDLALGRSGAELSSTGNYFLEFCRCGVLVPAFPLQYPNTAVVLMQAIVHQLLDYTRREFEKSSYEVLCTVWEKCTAWQCTRLGRAIMHTYRTQRDSPWYDTAIWIGNNQYNYYSDIKVLSIKSWNSSAAKLLSSMRQRFLAYHSQGTCQ